MVTRQFHIDYVVSVRAGSSSTQVSLSSGSSGITAPGGAGGGGIQTAGTAGGSQSSGDIVVQTQERIDFWTQLDARIRELMRDPLYEILRSEYEKKVLKRQLHMLPLEAEYNKELMKHRLQMFQLEREMAKKRIETGIGEGVAPQREITPPSISEAKEGAREEGREEEKKGRIVGSYTIDPQTGTIIVTTTSEIMRRIESFINQVRENLTRQVHIDLQILEVSLKKEKKLGVDWAGFPGIIQFFRMPGLRSVIESQIDAQATAGGAGAGAGGAGVGIYSPITASPFSSSPVGGLQAGILITPTSGQAIQFSINSIISFLQQQGDVRAISRPQITTLNNQPAVISVGVNDFFITFEQATTATTGGLATTQVTSKLNPIFIGVTLHITPQLSPQGEIIMKIVPAVNERIGEKVVPTGIPSAPTQTIPLLETRQTSTVVKAEDGQTIILSGLIQERDILVEKGVPLLSDLPFIGPLFKYTQREKGRSELVILLTPRLADLYPHMEGLGYKELPEKR
jgi:MSHA biogenesis protein MshL